MFRHWLVFAVLVIIALATKPCDKYELLTRKTCDRVGSTKNSRILLLCNESAQLLEACNGFHQKLDQLNATAARFIKELELDDRPPLPVFIDEFYQ